MFSKKQVVVLFFISVSLSAVAGMPDSGDWFIQQLSVGRVSDMQISDSIVAWNSYLGTCYYDGTGIYLLQNDSLYCYEFAVSGNSIVAAIGQSKILYRNGNIRRIINSGTAYCGRPDVYQGAIVWEGGSGYNFAQTDVYLYLCDGYMPCLTDNDQCWHNGNSPKIGGDTIVWRSFDGNDNEIFLWKNGVIQQLTCNDAEENPPIISDNGHVAWITDHWYGWHVHYFDGERTRQLTIDGGDATIWGISDEGVLYSYGEDGYIVLCFFDGVKKQILYEDKEAVSPMNFLEASMGGGAIAWAVAGKIYFYQNGQIQSWEYGEPGWSEQPIGVWGNRIVWYNHEDWNMYFAESLDSPVCKNPLTMDGNGDCKVDLADFLLLAAEWLQCGYDSSGSCG